MEKKTLSISYNAKKCFPYFQKDYVYPKMWLTLFFPTPMQGST
jgi:hypothetical protein